MSSDSEHPLAEIEPRLRSLLPGALYADAWLDPSKGNLSRVFEHLRRVHRILHDYLPRIVYDSPPKPGDIRNEWRRGTLMFTDLAGFTKLMEANAAHGQSGAYTLLEVLNQYYATMLEIISKSGGNLLEFTGDALLAVFPEDRLKDDAARAVRAGLRMQNAMEMFREIETDHGILSLGMRVGMHTGSFLEADVGTPRRMAHVLLGNSVLLAKQAEGAGQIGRVCLTEAAYELIKDDFECDKWGSDHWLIKKDSGVEIGEYEITPSRRRTSGLVLLDRSHEGLISAVNEALVLVEPLASYLPGSVLNVLVESLASRQIQPEFPDVTVVFVNILGLPESVDSASDEEIANVVSNFSRMFALIHGAVRTHDGTLKNVTYHTSGSDIVIYFGVPVAHADDDLRGAKAAVDIREIVQTFTPPTVDGKSLNISCQLGITRGRAFSAEIGEPRGRREFNVLGDIVNTSSHLMNMAEGNRIYISEAMYASVAASFDCKELGRLALKGKSQTLKAFELLNPK